MDESFNSLRDRGKWQSSTGNAYSDTRTVFLYLLIRLAGLKARSYGLVKIAGAGMEYYVKGQPGAGLEKRSIKRITEWWSAHGVSPFRRETHQ